MKAERRHELQTNTLALWLRWRAPQIWEKHGTKILLGLIVVVLAIYLIRWRMNAPKIALSNAQQRLLTARKQVEEMPRIEDPMQARQVPDLVQAALDESDDAIVQADGHAILGEYYWNLATLPDLDKGLAGGPARNSEAHYADSQKHFREVLKISGAPAYLVALSQLGLGDIEANLAWAKQRETGAASRPTNPHWDAAKEHYSAAADVAGVPPTLKAVAQSKLRQLPTLQKPIYFEKPKPTTQPSTQPATQPASEAAPATRPTP